MAATGPVRAFLSYGHEDSNWCKAVLKHIGWLEHSGQVAAFHDRELKPGERWDDRIKGELAASELVIALISPHFMGSRYCCMDELQPAITRQGTGDADLVPIVCDHVMLGPLAAHQCLPQDENNDLKPLCDWPNSNLPLARCAAKIRALVEARRPPAGTVVQPIPSPPPPAPAPLPRAAPSLSERLAAAIGARLGGFLEDLLRTTLGTATTARLPLPAPRLPPAAPPPAPTPQPAPSELFVGRQTDLDQLVLWILDADPGPIAVLGPGGIGKTALTRSALRDERCAARFGDRRLFVPMEEVRDAVGIHHAVARALGLAADDRPAERVLAALRTAPMLLVLDNAETPWETEPDKVERIFAQFAAVEGISLVASFRGYELPSGAGWRPLIVEPLAEDAARALFLAVAGGRYVSDPALPVLLARLDGLPLAIELVAHRARDEPNAATVLRQWDAERGRYPAHGEGGCKGLDLAASIALSLASPRMTGAGLRLFAVLGRLPHGLARADLAAIMPNCGADAVAALTRTGLIRRDPERLRMWAPVREQAAEQTLASHDAAALAGHFERLADSLPYQRESAADTAATTRARLELANIESVMRGPAYAARSAELHEQGRRWVRVGDARWTLGSLAPAKVAWTQAQSCFAALVISDPDNAEWQRDLSVSWERLGDVWVAQGDLPAALHAYNAVEDIADMLATADPHNAQRQRDLSVSWNKLGNVGRAQGDLTGALGAYTKGKSIRHRLAAADPGNAEWQRDLIVSLAKLAESAAAGPTPSAVADHYRGALHIPRDLAASDRLAPADAWMVTELERRLAATLAATDPPP